MRPSVTAGLKREKKERKEKERLGQTSPTKEEGRYYCCCCCAAEGNEAKDDVLRKCCDLSYSVLRRTKTKTT